MLKLILITSLIAFLTSCTTNKPLVMKPSFETKTRIQSGSSKMTGGDAFFEGRHYGNSRVPISTDQIGKKTGTYTHEGNYPPLEGDVYEIIGNSKEQHIAINILGTFDRFDIDAIEKNK